MKKINYIILFSYILFLILITGNSAFANKTEKEKILKTANELYTSGKFEEAISNYQKIIDDGYESADLYYNIGNSYYRSNKFTFAIYYYEKAKLLNPSDVDLLNNLELANLQITDKIIAVPQFSFVVILNDIIGSQSANFWAFLSIICFVLMLSLLLIYFFSKNINYKKISFYIGVFLFVVSVTGFIFMNKQHKNINAQNTAIVFSPSVFVKSSPDEKATEVFTIHEGLKVQIRDNSGDWCEIKLEDGKIGWMKKEGLKKI